MAVLFKPTGSLDVSTDASTIPDDGMQRCKNLSLNQSGMLKTRDGYSVVSESTQQDLTGYTEVDPNSKLVVTASAITATGIISNTDETYVYYDFGSNYFDAGFLHKLKLNASSIENTAQAAIWCVSNTVKSVSGMLAASENYLSVSIYNGVTFKSIILDEFYGTRVTTSWESLQTGTDYYLTIIRDESVGTYGTLYCYIYSDSDRTILVETLSLTLRGCVDYRYLYGISSWNTGGSAVTSVVVSEIVAGYTYPIYDVVEPSTSGTRYVFNGANISADNNIIKSGLTLAQWSTIVYNQYNSPIEAVFGLNGTDRKRIEGSTVFEWGAEKPGTRPAISAGTTTGLTGDYNAKYTYARKIDGTVVLESNPSNAPKTAATLANQSLAVTPTAPTDTQITHYRIYRTLVGGSLYYHDIDVQHVGGDYTYCFDWERSGEYISGVGYSAFVNDSYYKTVDCFTWEIDAEKETLYYLPYMGTSAGENENILGSIEVNVGDLSLGAEVETDHDRPPLGSFVFGPNYNGTCFILKDNLLYYSKPKQPEYWPDNYFVEVSPIQFPLKCGTFFNGQPYVSSPNEIYEIQGTGHNTFFPFKTQAVTGTKSIRGLIGVYGQGIFHAGTDGIYLYGGGLDRKITQNAFETIFRGADANGVLGVNDTEKSWLVQFRNKIYFFYPDDSETYPSNALVFDAENNRTTYYKYPVQLTAIAVEEGGERILAGDENGYIIHIEDKDETTDGGSVISWETQSKEFTLQTRRHFPRWVKYDVDASGAASATGELIMDGTSHQSHTITGDRVTKRRLVATGNGKRVSVKISGTGPVEIYAAEGE